MAINVGSLIGKAAGAIGGGVGAPSIDLTPGFNIDAHAGGGIPFISRGNGSTGVAPVATSNARVTAPTQTTQAAPQNLSGAFSGAGGASGGTNGTGTGLTGPQAAQYYSDQANDAQRQIDLLGGQKNQLLDNLGNAYNVGVKTLNDQFARAQRDYGDQRQQTINQNVDAGNSIDESVRNNSNALQRLLGAGGNGSAGDYANYVAAHQGTLQRQALQGNYAQNLQGLDKSFGDTTYNYNLGQSKLKDDLTNKQRQVEGQIESNRASLLSTLASLTTQANQARGQEYGTAVAAASPYLQQINDIRANQAALSKDYANPVLDTQGVAFSAPTLASYDTSAQSAVPVGSQDVVSDTVNPIYQSLLKKNQNGNLLA